MCTPTFVTYFLVVRNPSSVTPVEFTSVVIYRPAGAYPSSTLMMTVSETVWVPSETVSRRIIDVSEETRGAVNEVDIDEGSARVAWWAFRLSTAHC